MNRKPRAFRLDDPDVAQAQPGAPEPTAPVVVVEEPFDAIEAADGTIVPMPERRGAPWLGILISAVTGLILLGLGLALENLVVSLFAVAPWLGWVALALGVLALVAFLAIILRVAVGIWREQRI